MYAASGHMSVLVGATGRAEVQTGPFTAARISSVRPRAAGFVAYAGRYTVPDDIIKRVPDVSLFPNWAHTRLLRGATIADDHLTLELVRPRPLPHFKGTEVLVLGVESDQADRCNGSNFDAASADLPGSRPGASAHRAPAGCLH